jgi:hypothetical protein
MGQGRIATERRVRKLERDKAAKKKLKADKDPNVPVRLVELFSFDFLVMRPYLVCRKVCQGLWKTVDL